MKIKIINGPNLNLLGNREASIYGQQDFMSYLESLKQRYEHQIDYFQSNIEGELIDALQAASDYDAIILNAAGYTHTSVAILDSIRAIDVPVIEVHISNIYQREPYRQHSLIAEACVGSICGFGLNSYRLAIEAIQDRLL